VHESLYSAANQPLAPPAPSAGYNIRWLMLAIAGLGLDGLFLRLLQLGHLCAGWPDARADGSSGVGIDQQREP